MADYMPHLALLMNGSLYGQWPDVGVWPVLLSLADEDGAVDIIPRAIASMSGLPELDLLACIDRFVRRGWLEPIYPDRWGWQITENAEVRRPRRLRLGQSDWSILRAEIFARDDYTCRYCGEHGGKLECDHVIPVSRGGSNDPGNLVTSCFACNRSKRNKTVDEWRSAQ